MSTKITKYTCITLFPLLSTISYPRPINVHAIRNTVLTNGFCLYSRTDFTGVQIYGRN